MDGKVILASIYLVPFVIAAVMPGWRTFGAMVVTCLAYGLWLIFIKENESGGIALSMDKVFLWVVFWGLCVGVVTRGITLFLQQTGLPAWPLIGISVLGALAPPIILIALGILK